MQVQTQDKIAPTAGIPANHTSIAAYGTCSPVRLCSHDVTDADILSVLCDLFAGRAATAFGESLEWWAETFQCDLAAKAAGGVVLAAISKWPFDQRAGAEGVQQLQAELVKRARQILAREVQP